jgi:hypothetical protein
LAPSWVLWTTVPVEEVPAPVGTAATDLDDPLLENPVEQLRHGYFCELRQPVHGFELLLFD